MGNGGPASVSAERRWTAPRRTRVVPGPHSRTCSCVPTGISGGGGNQPAMRGKLDPGREPPAQTTCLSSATCLAPKYSFHPVSTRYPELAGASCIGFCIVAHAATERWLPLWLFSTAKRKPVVVVERQLDDRSWVQAVTRGPGLSPVCQGLRPIGRGPRERGPLAGSRYPPASSICAELATSRSVALLAE